MAVHQIMLSQGDLINKDLLRFPFEERGLQFGDGVYEVIRVYNGKFYLLQEHIERFYRSLRKIHLDISEEKTFLTQQLHSLLERNEITGDAKVYLQATRGSAPRDHVFPENTMPNVFAYVEDAKRNVKSMLQGVRTITLPDERWSNCHIKSLNLLPNLLAKQKAYESGSAEAILHKYGEVTECSSANVYMVKDGTIYTHPATNRILHGCVRMAVERFAKECSIPFTEEIFTLADMDEADEVFLSSSTSEITPIVEIDGKKVNGGVPGEVTRKLQQAYSVDAGIEHFFQ